MVQLALLSLVVFAAYARIVPAADFVFGASEPRLLEADSYYHLRHTRFCVAHFPELQRWDVATHYPHGQWAVTPGLFQVAMAGVTLVVGRGSPDETTLRTVLAWTPVALGCLALLLLFGMVRRLTDGITALLAVVLVTLYPAGFLRRTLLGFADHHAAEVVLVLGMVWGMVATLSVKTEQSQAAAWLRATVRALPVALLLFTWNGAPVYISVVALALFLALVLQIARGQVIPALVPPLTRFGVTLMTLVTVPPLLWPTLVMDPRHFPHGLVACLVLAAVPPTLLALSDHLGRAGMSPSRLSLSALGLAIAAVALGLWLVPEGARVLAVMVRPKIPWVAEHLAVSPARYWASLGWPGILTLIAPVVILVLSWSRGDRWPAVFATFVAALMTLEWILVRDYEYLIPPLAALAAALAVHTALHRLGWLGTAQRRTAAIGVIVVMAVVPIWPLGAHPLPTANAQVVRGMVVLTDGWRQAMDWMATHTPEPTLPTEARVAPFDDHHYPEGTYGVLASWDYGNLVSALGRRPTVASQGVSHTMATWFLMTDERQGLTHWETLMQPGERVRYVVIGAPTVSDHFAGMLGLLGRGPLEFIERKDAGQLPIYNDRFTRTLMWRLYHDAGDDLGHHRLVYQSPQKSLLFLRARSLRDADGRTGVAMRLRSEPMDRPAVERLHAELIRRGVVRTAEGVMYSPMILPSVRIFEIVPGMTVAGRASPGGTVEARLPLRSSSDGHAWTYRRRVPVGPDGRFEITLPYSTEESRISDVAASDVYRVSVLDGRRFGPLRGRRLAVRERQIQSGEWLDLGDLESLRE